MTDNTQGLEEILDDFGNWVLDNSAWMKLGGETDGKGAHRAKQAILDWHNKQIERPEPYKFSYLVKCSRCGHENRGEAMTPPSLDYLAEQRNKLKENTDGRI